MEGVNRRRGQLSVASKTKLDITIASWLLSGGSLLLILLLTGWSIFTDFSIMNGVSSQQYHQANAQPNTNVIISQQQDYVRHSEVVGTKTTDSLQEQTNINAVADISVVTCLISTPSSLSASATTVRTTDDNAGANGSILITVRHDLSPVASKVFIDLVMAHHFDNVFIFRVLKGFVAQWGVRTAGTENQVLSSLVNNKPSSTKDAVHGKTLSNVRGTLSFAGGNPATMQVFVNLGNNQRLDQENSRPFATLDHSSMNIMDQLYTGYQDGQVKTLALGQAVMREKFPRMSLVDHCRVVQPIDLD